MRRNGRLAVLGMALFLMLAPANVSLASHEGAWPPIKVELSIQQDGYFFTTVVWVKNEGHFDAGLLNIRAKVPKGAKYVDSWAGWGPGFNAGVCDGNDVGWVNPRVEAGGKQGPFVYIFDASALPLTLDLLYGPGLAGWGSRPEMRPPGQSG